VIKGGGLTITANQGNKKESEQKGDHIITVKIVIPTSLDPN